MSNASQALRAFLEAGRMSTAEGFKRMEAAGYTRSQTRRARTALGVVTTREGFGPTGTWYWALPTDDCPTCGRPLAAGPAPGPWSDRTALAGQATSGRQRGPADGAGTGRDRGPRACPICGLPGPAGRCRQPLRGVPNSVMRCPGVVP